jgi:ATP-dependent exoDNAse (exonuclease V) beta subunit
MSNDKKNIEKEIVAEDARARLQALDPRHSFIVQAPAGSGKTELLMRRFLRLLSTVERPEEILALTFTRKAAGEMHERIVSALMRADSNYVPENDYEAEGLQLAKGALQRNKELGWNLLENPARLKVQTIDSFSATLARQMPLLSGLGKSPHVTEKPEQLYREAARRTIAIIAGEDDSRGFEDVTLALLYMDNSAKALEDRLVTMLRKRDQWLRHLDNTSSLDSALEGEELRRNLEDALKNVVEDSLAGLGGLIPLKLQSELVSSAAFAAGNLKESKPDSPICELVGMKKLPDEAASELKEWRAIASLLLTDKNGWRKVKGVSVGIGFPADNETEAIKHKKNFKSILEELKENDALLSALKSVRELPDTNYTDAEWEILKALTHLLLIANKFLRDVFSEQATVDFQAISLSALEALGSEDSPTDLMLALDLRLRHILIDEYQDTSRSQLELIKALTRGWEDDDGRTLFIVGDPMQSIYRFREAEVGLFIEARELGVGNVHPKSLGLKHNFRSGASIVDWINENMRHVFGGNTSEAVNEDSFVGTVRYESFIAHSDNLKAKTPELRLFDSKNSDEDAINIVELIKDIREKNSEETIAVISRKKSTLREVVKELKKEGVSFRAEELELLADRPVVADLMCLLRALADLNDRIAWLAILRAPWAGLGLADIHALCANDASSPIWAFMTAKDRLLPLSKDGRARLVSLAEKIEKAMESYGRVELRGLLGGLWLELGGAGLYTNDATLEDVKADARAFFDMLEALDIYGEGSDVLSVAVEGLNSSQSCRVELEEAHPVDLLTIHKAKGLEFDNVIVPALGKTGKNDESELLTWKERDDDLLLAPIFNKAEDAKGTIYKYISGVEKKRAANEVARLFYVAVSRARRGLYMFGDLKQSKYNEFKAETGSFLSALGAKIDSYEVLSRMSDSDAAQDKARELKLARLRSGWILPEPKAGIPCNGTQVKAVDLDDKIEFSWAREGAKHLGTVVHYYLYRIASEGLSLWTRERVLAERRQIACMLLELGLNNKEADELSEAAALQLIEAITSERGRWLLAASPEASVEDKGNEAGVKDTSAELAISAVIDGTVKRMIIDRSFVDDGVRWVVDYKTGSHEGGSLDDFLENEKKRYSTQLNDYAAALKLNGEKREIKMGLYYPSLGEWVEL